MNQKLYFYRVGEKIYKYSYCMECGKGPFTEEQVIGGALKRMGSTLTPVHLCPLCENIKMGSVRDGKPSNLPQIETPVEEQ